MLLGVVDRLNRVQQPRIVATVTGRPGQRLYIFREAGTTVTTAGVDEMIANPGIGTNTTTDSFNVRAQSFGQVGDLIHEADLGSQHGIGGILGELRRPQIHEDHAVMAAIERVIDFPQQFRRPLAVGTDNNAVGLHEIIDGSAFLEELGVGHNVKIKLQPTAVKLGPDRCPDLVTSTNRHRGLVHDHLVVVHEFTDGPGHSSNVLQIR